MDILVSNETKIIDAQGHPIAGGFHNEGFQVGKQVRVMVRPKEVKNVLVGLMLVGDQPGQLPALPVGMTGVKPLAEMAPGEKYNGFEGGLYPGGDEPTAGRLERAGQALSRRIEPLDREGKPSAEGKIVVMSVGMSNATRRSAPSSRPPKETPRSTPPLLLVNAALGSMTADLVADVKGGYLLPDGSNLKYWPRVDVILDHFGVTRARCRSRGSRRPSADPTSGSPARRVLPGEAGEHPADPSRSVPEPEAGLPLEPHVRRAGPRSGSTQARCLRVELLHCRPVSLRQGCLIDFRLIW